MKKFLIAACVLLVSLCSLARAEEKPVVFLAKKWTVALPDAKFSVAKSDNETGVILADRGYLIADWKDGGILDFDLMFLGKPYLETEEQQISNAPHFSIGLRTKGEYLPERPFELKGDRSIRLRLAGGQALYEKPSNKKDEDAERLADKRFKALEPYVWHHIVFADSGKWCSLKINDVLVIDEDLDAPEKDNKIMLGSREFNAGQNWIILRQHR